MPRAFHDSALLIETFKGSQTWNVHIIITNYCDSTDMTKPLNSGKYDGQLLLCPPDDYEETSSLFSISFGLIVMYSSKYEIWRGFNQPNNSAVLRGNEADAVCRQLGYTQAIPGSALTQRAMLPNYTFNHC